MPHQLGTPNARNGLPSAVGQHRATVACHRRCRPWSIVCPTLTRSAGPQLFWDGALVLDVQPPQAR